MLLRNYLRTLASFQYLSDADVDHLAAAMRVEDYPNHHVFIYQDKLNKELFLLLDGKIKVGHYGTGGRYYTLKTIEPGEFFGIPSISEGKPAIATCQADGPVTVASMPFSAYLLLYQPDSDIGCRFQFVIASQLAKDLHDRHDALRKLLTQVYGEGQAGGA
ncbi:MAG TPA: cyclic nucleotide-binding domain-containing protein [Thiobacillaceae bacterium]|nr:cyclic nucleotide-binding domain-containing protein [Thiobacillaceae bacterium]HNA82525.1 cyclic nucleotide-binding domain-containing protein [Thiobacillaceae bacterium]HNF88761.1 cyclic nucleotide-binding domain-containing protein [Thiobacillaceae bacterium]HNH88993.1 cyclic nucleotide-binding domain-containing protein [Thiobacillaceae bacterium]HNI07278.1 cyclic nucleotide-binding domain-containing protein [Thiobacillaceae bacterium]